MVKMTASIINESGEVLDSCKISIFVFPSEYESLAPATEDEKPQEANDYKNPPEATENKKPESTDEKKLTETKSDEVGNKYSALLLKATLE